MTDVDLDRTTATRNPLLNRAVRLFEFLARTQQLRNQPPRTVDSYRRDGAVLWLADLPPHPAVSTAHRGDPEPEDALLWVDRLPRLDPPAPDDTLAPWLDGPIDDPDNPPELRENLADTPLERHPDVRERYFHWLASWRPWADRERADAPVRTRYAELFSVYVAAARNPEELELVAGVGCLAWAPPEHPRCAGT